jgi:hypothetical protein
MKRWFFVLVFACMPALAQPATQVNQARANVITGCVVNADGQPMRGVEVRVFHVNNNSTRGAVTDAEGKFTVSNLASGVYRVSAAREPYVAATRAQLNSNLIGDHVTLTMVKGGVITGRVLDARHEPVVGAMVSAQLVRNADGSTTATGGSWGNVITDDRGVYRMFGLPAGTYLVFARDNGGLATNVPTEPPTYYPSSSRATAREVEVGVGAEVYGIDIRWRGERGYTVSGTVAGLADPNVDTSIGISLTAAGALMASTRALDNRFVLHGVPDGDYELRAARSTVGTFVPRAFAALLPVRVRGGDVTGLEVKFLPPAMITGRVVVEKAARVPASCVINRPGRIEEILVRTLPFEVAPRPAPIGWQVAPEATGDFFVRNLTAGRFRLTADLPSDFWYLKSITRAAPRTQAARTMDVAQQGVTLSAGQQLTGLTLNVAEGAASVEGKVVTAAGTALPPRLVVHLLPLEATASELRYAVTAVRRDATFAFRSLAPGRYWLLVRPEAKADGRAELRRAAAQANTTIELLPCQRRQSLDLKFSRAVQ